MIADLLPEYYARSKDDMQYEVLRSTVINGHEVAWMSYTGTVKFDLTGSGREGEPFSGRTMMCECDFTEGIGWNIDEDGHRYTVSGQDAKATCLIRQAALYLRHLELRREYEERFVEPKRRTTKPWLVLESCIREIVLDMIEKGRAGEWLEGSNGAAFYGGYFYVQTLAVITDMDIGSLWEAVYALAEAKVIDVDGAVIKAYTQPPPPKWEEYLRIENDGWVGTAALPGNRHMAQEWKLTVFKPSGEVAADVPGKRLLHDPLFGPDVEDVERARQTLLDWIELCRPKS